MRYNNRFKIYLILILYLYINCISFNYNSSLMDFERTENIANKKIKIIFLRNINIDSEIEETKETQEFLKFSLKSNLKKMIENNVSESIKVAYYNEIDSKKNSIILDFNFDKYNNKIEVHPYYFPLSFFTATLYIWLGGPIIRMKYHMEGEISVYSIQNRGKIVKSFKLEIEETENLYDGFGVRRKIGKIRSDTILESLSEVLDDI